MTPCSPEVTVTPEDLRRRLEAFGERIRVLEALVACAGEMVDTAGEMRP